MIFAVMLINRTQNLTYMKKLLILSALLLFSLACQKKEPYSDFNAIKDGTKWFSDYSWATFSKLNKGIIIVGNKKIPGNEEKIYLSFKISNILETNTVKHFISERSIITGGDVASDQYNINTTANNLIQIISLDTVMKHISGKFSVKLFREPDKYMNFTNGEFNLDYKEEISSNSK
jgi:hypothetical protein